MLVQWQGMGFGIGGFSFGAVSSVGAGVSIGAGISVSAGLGISLESVVADTFQASGFSLNLSSFDLRAITAMINSLGLSLSLGGVTGTGFGLPFLSGLGTMGALGGVGALPSLGGILPSIGLPMGVAPMGMMGGAPLNVNISIGNRYPYQGFNGPNFNPMVLVMLVLLLAMLLAQARGGNLGGMYPAMPMAPSFAPRLPIGGRGINININITSARRMPLRQRRVLLRKLRQLLRRLQRQGNQVEITRIRIVINQLMGTVVI